MHFKQLTCLLWKFLKLELLSGSQSIILPIDNIRAPVLNEFSQCEGILNVLRSQHKRVILQRITVDHDVYGNNQANFLARK